MKILKMTALIISLLFICGCTQIKIYKGYKPVSLKLSDQLTLVFTVEVTPEKTNKNTIIYGSPYTLIGDAIILSDAAEVAMANVVLVNAESGVVKKLSDKYGVKVLASRDGGGEATFRYELGNLDYQNYNIRGKAVVDGLTHEFNVVLKVNYKKEKYNRFFDNLMDI